MRKPDLAAFIADRADIAPEQAALALDAILDQIAAALARGERVGVAGFGTLETRQRAARRGNNPQTGEPVEIAASVAIGFRPGKALRDALN